MTELRPDPLNLTYPPPPFNPAGAIEAGLGPSKMEDTGMPAILAGLLIPHLICTAFILARVSSRVFLLRKWFLDDSLILAAWAFSTGVCIVYSVAARTPGILTANDEQKLQNDLEAGGAEGSIHPYIMRTYLGLIFYQLCLCLTKLSILAFYLRMFNSRPRERRLAWGTVVFVLLYGIPMLFVSIFQCHPQPGQFFGHPMKCFGFAPLLIASASLHTATDVWLIVMVVPCISKLDLPPRQKIALAVVLSLSIFVIAASLVRLQLSLHRHFRPTSVGITNTLAFFVMTILECDIALICASAPTLRPLVAKMWPKMMVDPQSQSRFTLESGIASVNLTAVSYHGYPWTEPNTPFGRSRSGSVASHLHIMSKMPAPPLPTLSMSHRTPTQSLRSLLSTMAPRSRGRTLTGDDRPILVRGDSRLDSRPVSLGFEGYHDQYLGYGEQKPGSKNQISLRTDNLGGRSWAESQESFVLGLNDPLSPSRLSPVSGLSGETFAVLHDAASGKAKSIDGKMDKAETKPTPSHAAQPRSDEGGEKEDCQDDEKEKD